METYKQFRPTGFDVAGLSLHDRQDWLVVPVGRNRDSEVLAQSNYDSAIRMLEQDSPGEDYEEHSFNHWGCGWFEIIIVKPDTPAAKVAEEIEAALANYPVLDDEDHSRREWEIHSEHMGQELQRVAYKHDGEVHEEVDHIVLGRELDWSYHGISPTDEAIFDALCEHGWFVPDEPEAFGLSGAWSAEGKS